MGIRNWFLSLAVASGVVTSAAPAFAQAAASDTKWAIDVGIGISPSINGNVNSGAIGVLNGQATAILPNTYGDVYGTGLDLRIGGGYLIRPLTELRAIFVYQSADADLVRLGDIGPSSLYGQYSDYKSIGLDLGVRRYLPLDWENTRVYGEATIGFAAIDRIDVRLAAPQSNAVFDDNDFYDGTAAMTLALNIGMLFPVSSRVELNAQFGLRRVGGLADVDQFAGSGLEDINDDSARLTFPIVVGARFRF